MDQNNNQQVNRPVNTPPPEAPPIVPSSPPSPQNTISGSPQFSPGTPPVENKPGSKKLVIAIVIVAIILTIGITYFLLSHISPREPAVSEQTPVVVEPTATPTLIPTPTLSAEDVNSIDTGDPSTDIKSIDEDAKQL